MSEYNTITVTGLSGCVRGQLIAYDPTTLTYVPARPAWTRLDDGSLRPGPLSYICGVLITAPSASGNGILATDGVISDSGIISTLCDDSVVGPYYLSGEGRATSSVPTGLLPVYCGWLTAEGSFIFRPAAPAYDGHRHSYYPLQSEYFTSNGGVYQYNVNGADSQFTQIMAGVPPQALTVLHSGAVTTAYTISGGAFVNLPDNQNYAICGVNPFIANNPEVRAIAAAPGNSTTSVTQVYGTVYIDDAYPVVASGVPTGTCVAEISREGIRTAPVINTLTSGGRISITGSNGAYVISDEAAGTYIDFQTINANNVLIGASTNDALITFPQGVTASLLGIVRLPALASGSWTFKPFVWFVDPGTLTADVQVYKPTNLGSGGSAALTGATAEVMSTNDFTAPGGSLVQVVLTGTGGATTSLRAAGIYITGTTA